MNRPNILLLFSDQHHAFTDEMGVGTLPRTQHLDGLRRSGADFTKAYCNAPICVPSRMSFMSGQQPCAIGALNNDDRLSSMDPTFVHGLAAAGYRTVLCGKMHFLDPDFFHGFAENPLGEPAPDLFEKWKCESPDPRGWNETGPNPVIFSGPGRQGYQFYDRKVAETAAGTIRQHKGDGPLFLTAGFILPHNPYVCEPARFRYHYERIDSAALANRVGERHAHSCYLDEFQGVNGLKDLPLELHRRALAAYFGLCEELDENIGIILRALEDSGAGRETMVVYSSDHGEIAGRGGHWFKSAVTEDSARVPLLIAGAGVVPGRRSRVVGLTDLAVTLCEAGGASPPPAATGRSFFSALADASDTEPGQIICESVGRPGAAGPLWMMREGAWKYTYCHQPRFEVLCNLDDDPLEKDNLASEASCHDRLASFRKTREARWDAESVIKEWEHRRDARTYVTAATGTIQVPSPPAETRCPGGWNQFDAGELPPESWTFLGISKPESCSAPHMPRIPHAKPHAQSQGRYFALAKPIAGCNINPID